MRDQDCFSEDKNTKKAKRKMITFAKNGVEQEKVIFGIDLDTMVMGYGVIGKKEFKNHSKK